MEKFITKTSEQARLEARHHMKDTSCPECGGHGLCTRSSRYVREGFFKSKLQVKHNYRCIACSCEWNTGWQDR